MPIHVVPAKITVPPVQRELAPRPRLLARLASGLTGRLTLVSAPAGYGKTVLLAAWAERCGLPAAWIAIDAGDNDPARFLRVLAAALEPVCPGIGRILRDLFKSPQLPAQDELLAGLLGAIASSAGPFVLVLDDYHLIHAPAVHAIVAGLIEQLPVSVHPVIAARADPPLPIARLRARGALTELRLADLCFTPDEAVAFFNQVMKLGLTGEQIAVLNSRAEGWAAGLQLAALSLQTAPDRPDFIRSFSGSNRFILDYLIDEVLKGQSDAVQAFLVQTAILDRLAGPLCDAVTGRSDGQHMLEQLEQANLFLIALDADRTWYRYHQLFRDLLLKQAGRRSPGELAEWRRRAARWFESAGLAAEAIEYRLAAGDFEHGAGLVRAAAPAILQRGEIYTFRSWVQRLPEAVLRSDPDLALYHAWTLVMSAAVPEAVEDWLARVDQSAPETAARVAVLRGFLEYMQANAARAAPLLQHGAAGLPAGDDLFRYVADYALSAIHAMLGDLDTAARALEQTAQSSLRRGQVIWAAGALCELGEIHIRRGELPAARLDFERSLAAAVDDRGRPLPVAGRARMRLAELWREWNDLPRAEQECRAGIALAARLRAGAALSGYLTLAEILQAAGDSDGAWDAMHTAETLARQTTATELDDLIVACLRAALAVHQGRLAEAQAWAQQRRLTGKVDPADLDRAADYYKYHVLKYELLVMARWWIAAGRCQEALPLLELLRQKMEAQGRIHHVIEIELLAALAHHRLGETGQAQRCFERSLALAEPGGYLRMYLDQGAAVRPLLEQAARNKALAVYAARLLAALAAPAEVAPAGALTARELELLHLVAAGLSNQEIAARLVISLPTVKWHAGQIYAKLGVRSRTQAVARARALGYLKTTPE